MIAWEAKASLISKKSMSEVDRPALERTLGMAKAGPILYYQLSGQNQ